MLKNSTYIMTIIILSYCSAATPTPLETERTYWVPWTPEHTAQWELLEQEDTSISFSRRNEFFEDVHTLVQRDTHWNTFCNNLYKNNKMNIPFNGFEFAIIDKQNNDLLGFLKLNFIKKQHYLTLSYGIKQPARDKKLGHEIVALAIQLINQNSETGVISLKKDISKEMFWAKWYEQGKKETPDFDALLYFFEKTPVAIKGLLAAVDIINQPSLNLLVRYGMQPIEIVCSHYYLQERTNLFDFDIILAYPATPENNNERINQLTQNILSRDTQRIDNAYSFLKNTFNIPEDWQYYALNRQEKQQLQLMQSTHITTQFSDVKNRIKSLEVYAPPYCFVQ